MQVNYFLHRKENVADIFRKKTHSFFFFIFLQEKNNKFSKKKSFYEFSRTFPKINAIIKILIQKNHTRGKRQA